MKLENNTKICNRCKGNKFVVVKTKILALCKDSEAIIVCPMCSGKGLTVTKGEENVIS